MQETTLVALEYCSTRTRLVERQTTDLNFLTLKYSDGDSRVSVDLFAHAEKHSANREIVVGLSRSLMDVMRQELDYATAGGGIGISYSHPAHPFIAVTFLSAALSRVCPIRPTPNTLSMCVAVQKARQGNRCCPHCGMAHYDHHHEEND